MQNLGDRIRVARRAKRWSQAKLAARLGITASAVGHWERPNGHRPSSENLIEIAKHLSVSVEWLAIGCGEMCPPGSSGSLPGVISLSEEERTLLRRYKALPSPTRAILVQFMHALNPPSMERDRASAGRRYKESRDSLRPS